MMAAIVHTCGERQNFPLKVNRTIATAAPPARKPMKILMKTAKPMKAEARRA
jgi:hypothetical protein